MSRQILKLLTLGRTSVLFPNTMLLGPGYVTGWFLEQRSFSSQLCRACKIKLDVRCTSRSFSPSSACSESARSLESPSKLCSYQTCRIVSPLKSEYILSCSGFQTWKMASERYSFSLTTFSPRYLEMSNAFCGRVEFTCGSVEFKTLKIVPHVKVRGSYESTTYVAFCF